MKQAIFTLALITSFIPFTFSQSETDFVNFDNQWNLLTSDNGGHASTNKYRFNEDSITVNNLVYFTMKYSGEELSQDWTSYEQAAYRQEEKKVYQLNLFDSTEVLLYDFSLEIGDVLLGTDYIGEPDLTVVEIDSIRLEDGSMRKQLHMSSGNSCTIQWVEGLGSIVYAFNSAMYTCFTDIGTTLICFSQNDTPLFYENEDFFGCWYESSPPEPNLITFGSQWNILSSSQFDGNQSTTKHRFRASPQFLNGKIYFQTERSSEENGSDWLLNDNYAYREEDEKVYLYNITDSTEVLIHDFGLSVGDIFISKQYISDPGIELIVTTVDTVQLADESDRKRILLNCESGDFEIQWVEGIGNIDYPLLSTIYSCFFDVPGSLLCYSENGETLYEDISNVEGCWYDYDTEVNNLVNSASEWHILTSSQFNSDLKTAKVRFDYPEKIYNGLEYYHLESIDDPGSANWILDETQAFREEEEKIYIYNVANNSEILIHDFGLNIGDTFLSKQSVDDPGTTLTVTDIDSLELIDGSLRKRIKLNCELNNTISWVKGIGNISYPLAGTVSSCQLEFNTQILCYSEFGQTQYEGVSNFEGCWVTAVEEIPDLEITIYPNPVINHIYIDAENSITNAKIYNLQGQLVLEKVDVSSMELVDINTGMYFLHLVNSKGQELTKKILVE